MLGHGGGGSAVLPRFPRAVKTISLDLEQLSFRLLLAAHRNCHSVANRIESYFCRSAVGAQPISVLVTSSLCYRSSSSSSSSSSWRRRKQALRAVVCIREMDVESQILVIQYYSKLPIIRCHGDQRYNHTERRFQQFRFQLLARNGNGSYGTKERQQYNGTTERRNGNGRTATADGDGMWKPGIIPMQKLRILCGSDVRNCLQICLPVTKVDF